MALVTPFVIPATAPVSGLPPLDDGPAPALVDDGLTLFPDVMFGHIGLITELDTVWFGDGLAIGVDATGVGCTAGVMVGVAGWVAGPALAVEKSLTSGWGG